MPSTSLALGPFWGVVFSAVGIWGVSFFLTVGENHGWFSKDVGNPPKNIKYPKVNDHMAGWNITLVFNRDALPETNSSPLKIGRAPKGNDPIPTIHFQVRTASLPDGTSDQIGWSCPLSFVTSCGWARGFDSGLRLRKSNLNCRPLYRESVEKQRIQRKWPKKPPEPGQYQVLPKEW